MSVPPAQDAKSTTLEKLLRDLDNAHKELLHHPSPPKVELRPTVDATDALTQVGDTANWLASFGACNVKYQSAFAQYMDASRTEYERFSKRTTWAIVVATIVIAGANIAAPLCNYYFPPRVAPPQVVVVAGPPQTTVLQAPSLPTASSVATPPSAAASGEPKPGTPVTHRDGSASGRPDGKRRQP